MTVGIQSEVYFVTEDGPIGGAFVLVCVVSAFQFDVQPFEFSIYTLSQTAQGKGY